MPWLPALSMWAGIASSAARASSSHQRSGAIGEVALRWAGQRQVRMFRAAITCSKPNRRRLCRGSAARLPMTTPTRPGRAPMKRLSSGGEWCGWRRCRCRRSGCVATRARRTRSVTTTVSCATRSSIAGAAPAEWSAPSRRRRRNGSAARRAAHGRGREHVHRLHARQRGAARRARARACSCWLSRVMKLFVPEGSTKTMRALWLRASCAAAGSGR